MEVIRVNGWLDSKNEFVLFSFCERQFSTLTSYWCTTWVDNMNANKIRKKKHQYVQIEAGGFGRRVKLDLTGYVKIKVLQERERRQKENKNFSVFYWQRKTRFIIEKTNKKKSHRSESRTCTFMYHGRRCHFGSGF